MKCARCRNEFTPERSTAQFCSGRCRAAASRARREGGSVELVPVTEWPEGDVCAGLRADFGDALNKSAAVALLLAKHLDNEDPDDCVGVCGGV